MDTLNFRTQCLHNLFCNKILCSVSNFLNSIINSLHIKHCGINVADDADNTWLAVALEDKFLSSAFHLPCLFKIKHVCMY